MMHRRRRRRGRRGRNPSPVYINHLPIARKFTPTPRGDGPPIQLEPSEMEALRLVDLEDLSQEEAGKQMGVSRGTVWRLLQNARKKVITAIIQGRVLDIPQPEAE
ncbi:DUF134 domain-containing protein [archaeon]|nr:DUF134 domain-containing protein [archaeon]